MVSSESMLPSAPAKCKIFRGENYLLKNSDRTCGFPDRRHITWRSAIPLIFLRSCFWRPLATRSLLTNVPGSEPFIVLVLVAIASCLDTADRLFPIARVPWKLKTGNSPESHGLVLPAYR